MSDANARAMVMASFIADGLALGEHWVYDQSKIEGRVDAYRTPSSYHSTKKIGQFTHYGDQTMILLASVADKGGFDLQDFFDRWVSAMAEGGSFDGYRDMATKKTLGRIEFGEGAETSGSPSNDLSGASRIGPVVFAHRADPAAAVAAARAQAAMTHNNALVLDAAEFFARTALAALHGDAPVAAMQKALSEGNYVDMSFARYVNAGLALADTDTKAATLELGPTCHADEAIAATVQAIARHADSLENGIVETIMAGGDNAARAMLVGLVLGAAHGDGAIPQGWKDGLAAGDEIAQALETIG